MQRRFFQLKSIHSDFLGQFTVTSSDRFPRSDSINPYVGNLVREIQVGETWVHHISSTRSSMGTILKGTQPIKNLKFWEPPPNLCVFSQKSHNWYGGTILLQLLLGFLWKPDGMTIVWGLPKPWKQWVNNLFSYQGIPINLHYPLSPLLQCLGRTQSSVNIVLRGCLKKLPHIK